ncbi:MAG: 1-(5-phosphoribosyl)-5-[(5-phosphoribosylamino)methylideneamino] imidazole-4-carboxamide isomerase [Gammaproteobacteria bacterium]|nr:1-(5-phosphoribosyl)-5-[(5-phosphoribosylamino)methylideneamino] imidazole-4-carboxamide isomerase [Gammaproteobacteria bacterium]
MRLYKGRFDNETVYPVAPLTLAKDYQAAGIGLIHIVDLDAARSGSYNNLDIIAAITELENFQVQVGGGVRSQQAVEQLWSLGVQRAVVGTAAVTNKDLVSNWFKEYGADKLVLAMDVRGTDFDTPKLAVGGWELESQDGLWETLDYYSAAGLRHVLCTDIDRDGALLGPNVGLYKEILRRYPQLQLQASGGVGGLEDVQLLADINVAGIIVGRALLEKELSVTQALEALAC